MEETLASVGLLLRHCTRSDAHRELGQRLATSVWRGHRDVIADFTRGADESQLQRATVKLLPGLVLAHPAVARELLQMLPDAAAVQRLLCLKANLPSNLQANAEDDDKGRSSQRTADIYFGVELGLSLMSSLTDVLLRKLLTGHLRPLAAAPLRALNRLPIPMQIRVLSTVQRHVLLSSSLPVQLKLALCGPSLCSVAALYSIPAPATDAHDNLSADDVAALAHSYLLLACTRLYPSRLAVVEMSQPVGAQAAVAPGSTTPVDAPGADAASTSGPHKATTDPDGAGVEVAAGVAGGGRKGGDGRDGFMNSVLRLLLTLSPTTDLRQQVRPPCSVHAMASAPHLAVAPPPSSTPQPNSAAAELCMIPALCRTQELLLSTLAAVPQLLPRYLHHTPPLLTEPRLSRETLAQLAFTTRLLHPEQRTAAAAAAAAYNDSGKDSATHPDSAAASAADSAAASASVAADADPYASEVAHRDAVARTAATRQKQEGYKGPPRTVVCQLVCKIGRGFWSKALLHQSALVRCESPPSRVTAIWFASTLKLAALVPCTPTHP